MTQPEYKRNCYDVKYPPAGLKQKKFIHAASIAILTKIGF
jgi:hypothetical protein